MNESKNDFGKEGSIIQYEKLARKAFGPGFLFLFGMFIFVLFLPDIIDVLVHGKLNFDMTGSYIEVLFPLSFLGLSIGGLLNYFGNKITISESFIKIRKTAFGKTHIISPRCVRGKFTLFTSVRGREEYRIILYLKNGKKISTGCLNCNSKEFDKINKEFKFKEIIDRRMLKEKLANLNNEEIDNGDFVTKHNYFLKMITFFPLILLIIGVFLLSSGFNEKCGVQDNFHVNGVVVDKKAGKNKNSVYYNIRVLEDNTSKEYNIDVDSKSYEYCNLNGKLQITGKRGSMGILYDVYFRKMR